MSLAEVNRAIQSKQRVMKANQKQQAIFDYTLADLIGRSIARIHNSNATMPSLAAAYPSLFDVVEEQEKIQEQKNELSALRFKLFAQSYNKNFKEVLEKNE